MNKYYVYVHKTILTGIVFYVGRGYSDRAFRRGSKRTKEWNDVVEKGGGFTVEFIAKNLSYKESIELENFYLLNPDISWNLVNKKREENVKDLNLLREKFLHYLTYDESSPSCLIWKNKYKNSKIKIGSIAGYLNKKHGYYEISIEGKRYYAHRIIYTMFNDLSENDVIDHLDGNSSNNKISNLRAVSQSKNCKNKKISANTKTGIIGVQYRVNSCGNEYYQASYTEDGIAKVKLFSVKKLGKESALESAIKYRKEKNVE